MSTSKRIGIAAILIIIIIAIALGAYYMTLPPPTEEITPTTPAKPPPPPAKKLKLAYITDDSLADRGWAMAHYEGVLRIRDELGWEVAYSDLVPPSDWETVIRSYAEKKYDLILLAGAQFVELAIKLGPEYPDIKFAVTQGYPGPEYPPNVASFDMRVEESAYLAGTLAAGMTKTKKIGIMDGVDYPSVIRLIEAFKLAIKKENPGVEIREVWTGDWYDTAKAYESTKSMIDRGADIVYIYISTAIVGATTAIKEKPDIAFIGSYRDQVELAPERALTSVVFKFPEAAIKIAKLVEGDKWEGGYHSWGLSEGLCGIAPYHAFENKIPQELKDKVSQLENDIKEGRFKVPQIWEHEGYKEYL
ncbi:MAG: BMP family protein [Candidatus Bathyarchaeia archaeon]